MNKVQNFDKDMILQMKRVEVEDEIRQRVDILMREEMDILKIVSVFMRLHCSYQRELWLQLKES